MYRIRWPWWILYNSTGGGPGWVLTTPVATWSGVTVTAGRVTGLDLDGYYLSGTIPSSLGNLSELTILDLAIGYLSDSIPSSLGNLSKLTDLELYDNLLSSTIPSSLGNLSNLTQLDLGENQLSGSIPSSLGNLSNLAYLNLGANILSGSIPSSLGNLSDLTVLVLAYNQLSDSIPATLDALPDLDALNLANNQLTFAGMEGIATAYAALSPYVTYAPQANITLNYNDGQLSVSAGGTLSNNTYYWYNSGLLVATNIGDSVFPVTETGNYSVAVTNTIATQLTLYSDTVDVSSLPVKFLSFTAQKQGTQALLQWTTTQEINSSYYTVERSSDDVNFTAIGQLSAKGNIVATVAYSFIDNKPVNGINYYRLRVVDKDGKYTYSEIRSINVTINFAANIYPNPVQNDLNLNFNCNKAMTVQVEIVSGEGKIISSQQIKVAAGVSTQSMNSASLSNGVYYVRCISANGETELRFVKEK